MLNFKSVNRDKVRQSTGFEMLPKGAYVVKIIGIKVVDNQSGAGQHLKIAFDIAEGQYKDFYKKQFDSNPNEDKMWPFDAVFLLTIPTDSSPEWMSEQFFTFLANVEDSNEGYTFNGDETKLNGKIFGGLFCNEQSESNGNVYDHTKLRWTRAADDVRKNKYGKLPKDKLISKKSSSGSGMDDVEKYIAVPEDAGEDGCPFL